MCDCCGRSFIEHEFLCERSRFTKINTSVNLVIFKQSTHLSINVSEADVLQILSLKRPEPYKNKVLTLCKS